MGDRMQYVPADSKVRTTFDGQTENMRQQTVNLFGVEVSESDPEATDSTATRVFETESIGAA